MLKVENIQKGFGRDNKILDSVSFSAAKGQALCIAGKNASGKTTLLKIICGMLAPDSGAVSADGRISIVPQEPAVLPELSVNDNLRLWYAAQNVSGPQWKDDSIETQLGLKEHRRKKVKTLSGGMKKRLSLAAALADIPDWLLLDEPFAALDAAGCRDIISLLCRLKSDGVGIIFTSHQPEHIAAVADRLLILDGGKLTEAPPPSGSDHRQLAAYILSSLYPKGD